MAAFQERSMSQPSLSQAAEEGRAADVQPMAETRDPGQKSRDVADIAPGASGTADALVAQIAGMTAQGVPGVFAVTSAARRVATAPTSRAAGRGGEVRTPSVGDLDTGEPHASVVVTIVLERDASIVDVGSRLRHDVIQAVGLGTGLELAAVDVDVTDIDLP